jgi:anaerobic magnesium-protoporphyrin IX monomethyl ester cyclase
MEEFKINLAKYDPKYVSVHDDNFTTNPKWVEEFCEFYRKEVNLPWYCFGYPTTIRPQLLRAMKAANCHTIFMGVDSGDADMRRHMMERPMTDDLIKNAAQLIKEHGIGLQASCIYGNPGETPAQMFKTLRMIDEIKPTQSSAYVFYPFPKTKLYHHSVELGYLDPEGEEKVRQGISGYHHESILRHPHKELAETLAKITPVYAKSPEFLKPLMRWIIQHRMKRLALMLYIVLIPLTFPYLGVEGIKVTLRMAWKAITGKRPAQPIAQAESPPAQAA